MGEDEKDRASCWHGEKSIRACQRPAVERGARGLAETNNTRGGAGGYEQYPGRRGARRQPALHQAAYNWRVNQSQKRGDVVSIRPVKRVAQSRPTIEGAGVHLRRAFGFGDPKEFDPFLLFDDFRNDNPDEYLAGFPWHPHRGIETITYVLAGRVEHGDSLGNQGTLADGDVQWMTAGSGILHQEMPKGDERGRMHGF